MKKETNPSELNPEKDRMEEPALEYFTETDMIASPPLTEEELRDAITGEELLQHVYDHIHKLFNKE